MPIKKTKFYVHVQGPLGAAGCGLFTSIAIVTLVILFWRPALVWLILGGLTVAFCVFLVAYCIREVFNPRPQLIVSDTGIKEQRPNEEAVLIEWEQIVNITGSAGTNEFNEQFAAVTVEWVDEAGDSHTTPVLIGGLDQRAKVVLKTILKAWNIASDEGRSTPPARADKLRNQEPEPISYPAGQKALLTFDEDGLWFRGEGDDDELQIPWFRIEELTVEKKKLIKYSAAEIMKGFTSGGNSTNDGIEGDVGMLGMKVTAGLAAAGIAAALNAALGKHKMEVEYRTKTGKLKEAIIPLGGLGEKPWDILAAAERRRKYYVKKGTMPEGGPS